MTIGYRAIAAEVINLYAMRNLCHLDLSKCLTEGEWHRMSKTPNDVMKLWKVIVTIFIIIGHLDLYKDIKR